MEEITLEQFKALFETMFFSKKSKRIDLELTSAKHKYNQAEYIAKNQVDPYFSEFLSRTVFPGNITDFKKQATFMADNIKLQYMRKKGVYVKSRPVLGYWKIRGLGANIRYQLKYCGVDFDSQHYFGFEDWFKRDKKELGLEFPNIPYLIHGDTKITETIAIHQYIAEEWDNTLLGKNAQDKAKVTMLVSIIQEFRWKIIRLCYDQDDRNKAMEEYRKHLPKVAEYLGDNDFLVGDYPTYIDFYFFETLQLCNMIRERGLFTEYPRLGAYNEKFCNLKGVKDYINDPFCSDEFLLFNAWGGISKINGKMGYEK